MSDTIFSHTVAVGDPFNGITLWGLWPTVDEAARWAEENRRNEDWHVVPIESTTNIFGQQVTP